MPSNDSPCGSFQIVAKLISRSWPNTINPKKLDLIIVLPHKRRLPPLLLLWFCPQVGKEDDLLETRWKIFLPVGASRSLNVFGIFVQITAGRFQMRKRPEHVRKGIELPELRNDCVS